MARALPAVRAARHHGGNGVLLVSGPTGIGRTALLSEICRQARSMKLRVASTRCDRIEQARPGGPVIAMLRAGATCVDLYSAFIYQGWRVARRINTELAALLRQHAAAHATDAVAGARPAGA